MLDEYTYEVGDKELITGCGDDGFGIAEATIIYVDKKYAVGRVRCGSEAYAWGLNLDPNIYKQMPREEVAKLVDISQYGEYDVFLNYYQSEYGTNKEYLIDVYDDNGVPLEYKIVGEEPYYIAPCGTQAISILAIVKLYGEPAAGQSISPLEDSEIEKRGLSKDGNYYVISDTHTKQYDINDWVEFSKWDDDGELAYIYSGNIVYSYCNVAFLQCRPDFYKIGKDDGFKIITYDELSHKPGFVPFFENTEGCIYVEIPQASGETGEIFMHVQKCFNGHPVNFTIMGYLFKGSTILGRFMSIETDVVESALAEAGLAPNEEAYDANALVKENGVLELPSSLSGLFVFPYLGYDGIGRDGLYYFPLGEGETVSILRG